MVTALTYSIRRIVHPSKDEIEEMTDVLIAAFSAGECFQRHHVVVITFHLSPADDQLAVGFGDDAPKLRRPINHAPVVAASMGGQIYVAESEGKIIGVSIWFEPGREIYDSAEQREAVLVPLQQLYRPETTKWLSELSVEIRKVKIAAWGETMSKDQWYLQRIGVAPEYQKHGVGSALIREIMGKADGMKIALTTIMNDNAAYYGRLGFKTLGHGSFDAPHGVIEITVMLWEPEQGI